MRHFRRFRFFRCVALSLTLPLMSAGLVGCAARSPASSESGSPVLPASVAINDFAVGMSVGDIVGWHTVRDTNGITRRCWNYRLGPEFSQTLVEHRAILQGDSLQFEVIEEPDRPFQLGGIVTDLWYESSNETSPVSRWQRHCYSIRVGRSVLARLRVSWELFDNRRGQVVYRTTTSGRARGLSFGAATDDALWNAQAKLVEDEELLNLLSG